MQNMRALLLGLGVAAASLMVCALLLIIIPTKQSFEAVKPLQPGVVLTSEELETRTRLAEAELASARAHVQAAGFSNVLRTDTAKFFALIAPLALLAGSMLFGKTRLMGILVYTSPVLATSILLGLRIEALLPITIAVLLLFVLKRQAPTATGDA